MSDFEAYNKRFAISDYLKDLLPHEYREFMINLDRLFVEKNVFLLAVSSLSGVAKGNMAVVLNTISNATLAWGKPFERINRKEFTYTIREAGGSFSSGMSESTVVRCLKVLEKEGLICRFRAGNMANVHYGICVRRIFELTTDAFSNMASICSKSAIKIGMWRRMTESPIVDYIQNLVCAFADKIVSCVRDAKQILSNVRYSVALEDNINAAKIKAVEITKARKQTKASQPLFDNNGKPNPGAALALWQKEIDDAEHWGRYVQIKTKRVIGMMKNWLLECAQAGEDEAAIRAKIHEYVHRWNYVSDKDRSMTIMSKNGRPYECRLESAPDFEFFYGKRSIISAILMKTCIPGKNMDGSDEIDMPEWY